MQKNGEVLRGIITVIVWVLAIIAVAFAAYIYISPEPAQIVQKSYLGIDSSYYDVDENELNGQWLSIQDYTIDKNDLNRYQDLKEYYKGRDNPFGVTDIIREEIVVEQQLISSKDDEEIEIE